MVREISGKGIHDKKAEVEEQNFRSFRLLCFSRSYHSCFGKKHFPFIYGLPIARCSYCEFWASLLYFPLLLAKLLSHYSLMGVTNNIPRHKITQKCFRGPSSLFGVQISKWVHFDQLHPLLFFSVKILKIKIVSCLLQRILLFHTKDSMLTSEITPLVDSCKVICHSSSRSQHLMM